MGHPGATTSPEPQLDRSGLVWAFLCCACTGPAPGAEDTAGNELAGSTRQPAVVEVVEQEVPDPEPAPQRPSQERDRWTSGPSLSELYVHSDPEATLFGRSACALDDLDGDGLVDYAIAAPMAWSGMERTGSVLVFAGSEPGVVRRFDGAGHGAGFGSDLTTVGDLDGDGHLELAVGSFETQREVQIVSPATGKMLFRFPYQSRCLGLYGDHDGDGATDILLERGNERIVAYRNIFSTQERRDSGTDLIEPIIVDPATLRSVFSTTAGQDLGPAPGWGSAPLRWIGDINEDGYADFAHMPRRRERKIEIRSGRDGTKLFGLLLPPGFGSWLYHPIVLDVGGDGTMDLLVNASDSQTGVGQLAAYDLSRGTLNATFVLDRVHGPLVEDWLCYYLFAPGDLDGDGVADFVAANQVTFDTRLGAHSGIDGALLWSIQKAVDFDAEVGFAHLGDRDGDGRPDFLVCSVGYIPDGGPPQYIDNGTVLILSGKDGVILHRLEEMDFPQLRK